MRGSSDCAVADGVTSNEALRLAPEARRARPPQVLQLQGLFEDEIVTQSNTSPVRCSCPNDCSS